MFSGNKSRVGSREFVPWRRCDGVRSGRDRRRRVSVCVQLAKNYIFAESDVCVRSTGEQHWSLEGSFFGQLAPSDLCSRELAAANAAIKAHSRAQSSAIRPTRPHPHRPVPQLLVRYYYCRYTARSRSPFTTLHPLRPLHRITPD